MECQVSNGQVKVVLSGKIYVEEASDIRSKLLRFLEQGQHHFSIHMDQVSYIDSSGLGVLIAIHKRVQEHEGRLTIYGLRGSVRELFDLTRLNRVFDIRD